MNDSERRAARRASRPIDVTFSCDGATHQGRIEDLSETGAFISAGHFWPTHIHVKLEFTLPDARSSDPIHANGTVVWAEQIGFGVRFDGLEQAVCDRIRFYVESEMFGGNQAIGSARAAARTR